MTKPTPRQLEYQDWEFGIFLHFGIRTFYEGHRDWDGKPMEPSAFNPTELDCEQWVKTAKNAGARYMVFVAKHHDGFANWPSRYAEFSVASSPWRNGQGDVVKEFTEACHKHEMKVGLYYSPADWTCPVYEDAQAYDDYFINQISEILEPYGQVDMLWFDGCGSENHEYDWPRIIGEVRRMQPEILVFNMGDPDYRWCGNEAGLAPYPYSNVVDAVDFSVKTDAKEKLADKLWLPVECDLMMRHRNWFYEDADADTVKTPEELMGIYDLSVGRGANMLLNIGPDRRGLLPDPDAASLTTFGEALRRRFSRPVLSFDKFEREGDAWIAGGQGNEFHIDQLVLMEDLKEGESIRRFEIRVTSYTGGKPVTVYEGYNPGHKHIARFPRVRARNVQLVVTEADGPPVMRDIAAFLGS